MQEARQSHNATFMIPFGIPWAMLGASLSLAVGVAYGQPDGIPETDAAPAGPAIVETDDERYITMDFQRVELAVLVKFIGEITGKNFVMDERVQGQVTVVSPTRVTPEEAYQLFQAVLQVKGFTTVPSGAAIRIIPTKEAKGTSLRTLTDGAAIVPSEEYITRVVPLVEVDAADLVNVLQPLVSPDGLITASPHTNALIMIDAAANISRLMTLVDELDVASSRRKTALIPVKHTVASELAEMIQLVLEDQGPGAAAAQGGKPMVRIHAFRIIPDDRTNTLIVQAPAEQMRQIKALTTSLDVTLPAGSGRIHVYYLKFADAEDLLPVLLDVIGAQGGGRRPGQRAPQTGSSLQRAGQRNRPQPARNPPVRGGQTGPGAVEFASDIRITADPATNSLIVTAAPEDFTLLAGVIAQLDIQRPQVSVEAILLEITMDRMRELGIELQGATSIGGGVGIARSNLSNLNQALAAPGSLPGLIAAAVSEQKVELPDGSLVPANIALLTALEDEQDINVLSAPSILTTDNEEAEIIVGQNVPFVASRSTDATNLANTFSTIEREDVGITLRLTPQISEGSMVRLSIFEEVSRLVPNPLLDANEVGPTTTVRSASTTVTVRDGQTVVVGGLISDATTSTESRVPFVADIPVIGNLFKSNSTEVEKINLLIFLTPRIIKDEMDAAALSIAERDRFRALSGQMSTPERPLDPLERPSFEVQHRPEIAASPSTIRTDDADESDVVALRSVRVDRGPGPPTIELDVGLPPVRVTHFALENPARLVLDVYGRSHPDPNVDVVPVDDPLVQRLRVARHSGRVRIVLDLHTGTPPRYRLETRGATLHLVITHAQPPDAPEEP